MRCFISHDLIGNVCEEWGIRRGGIQIETGPWGGGHALDFAVFTSYLKSLQILIAFISKKLIIMLLGRLQFVILLSMKHLKCAVASSCATIRRQGFHLFSHTGL